MENLDAKALQYLAGLKKTIEECGMAPMASPKVPASINVTAGSGPELSAMLKDIMNLAGVDHHAHQVLPGNEPTDQLQHPSKEVVPSMQDLIKVVDMPQEEMIQDGMNDDQRMYDNSPDEEGKAVGNWPLDGDQDNNLSAAKDVVVDRNKVTTAESLMAEYQSFFLSEGMPLSRKRLELEKIVNKYKTIPGSHEPTMLQGIHHAYCDSGILTDALSKEDAARFDAAGIDPDQPDEEFNDMDYWDDINSRIKKADGKGDLQSFTAIKELEKLTDDETDMEGLCKYMIEIMDGVQEGRDVFGDETDDYYPDLDDEDDELSHRRNRFADPTGHSALHAADENNPRIYPCPTCKRPDMLTRKDVQRGYQCDRCADATEQGLDIYENDIDADDLNEAKKWVQKAVKGIKKGALRKQEGKKKGEKFSKTELKTLAKTGTPKEKKRAQFALNISKK